MHANDTYRPHETSHSLDTRSEVAFQLWDSYTRFCTLLTLAEEKLAAKDLPTAIGLGQMAAQYAYPGNVGLFGSQRLERILVEAGRQISSVSVHHTRRHGHVRNILHVLTYGRPVGGDSRFAWRWIQEDPDNRHFVAITSNTSGYQVPDILTHAAERSGGYLRILSAPTSNPIEKARELRTLCQAMDIVVLHVFPYDTIPVLALASDCDSAKVIFINHSDHTFWIGASVAHSVAHLRAQSSEFLLERRGLNIAQSSLLPIPLFHSPRPISSTQAKRALGFPPDITLLLTIASPFKYRGAGGVNFLDLVTPVICRHSQSILIAVGPEDGGEWRCASLQTDGRIVALGTRWDNDLLYAAADVYLDSVPFSSITSLLEAGSRGIPLLGYHMSHADLSLLGPGAPGLENSMLLADDPGTYQSLLTGLIVDVGWRRRKGQELESQIVSIHTGGKWRQTVHALYEHVEDIEDRNCLIGDNDTFEPGPLNTALSSLYSQTRTRQLITDYLGGLCYTSRLSITWRLYCEGFDLALLNLFPSPVNVVLRRARRWGRKVVKGLSRHKLNWGHGGNR